MKKLFSLVVVSALALAGCSSGADKPEKDRYVDATIEATCMIFQDGADLTDSSVDWESKAREIFAKHGFPADDDAKMEEISAKYENDETVQKAVEGALKECAGDVFNSLGGEEASTDEELTESAEEAASEATDSTEDSAAETEAVETTEAPETEAPATKDAPTE